MTMRKIACLVLAIAGVCLTVSPGMPLHAPEPEPIPPAVAAVSLVQRMTPETLADIPGTYTDPDMTPDAWPTYTAEELEMLACTIYVEGGGDDISDDTRIMIGNVVLNRMADSRFPAAMYDVLTQDRQFNTFSWTGIVWPENPDTEALTRSYDCARRVLEGETLLDEDVIWMAEFRQGTVVAWQDGLYFGK